MRIIRLVVGELAANCYLLVSEREAAVVDPGGEPEKILEETIKQKAKVKYIINTHYHYDHTSAVERISQETGAEILIHEGERGFVDFKVNKFLKEDDKIKVGKFVLEVIHTPGHTKGSVCLRAGGELIFSGDTIFKDGYGRTDLPGGSAEDMIKSLEKLKGVFKKGMLIYPGHGEIFKVK